MEKYLHIELYNKKWFNKPLQTPISPFTYQLILLKYQSSPFLSFHQWVYFMKKLTLVPQLLFEKVDATFSNTLSPLTLHKSFDTIYCLFFIQYISKNTIKPRWFLVQINHHETEILKIDLLCTGNYHVTFLSHHPADKYICDDVNRWLLEWHKYYLDDSNIPIYGAHMLFSPKRNPYLTKYML